MISSFKIIDVAELSTQQVLSVINAAFGRNESAAWFDWKHREGPWGPSIGIAAVDQGGPIGVRLLLPWRFRLNGVPVVGHRATEAATIPRAQGRGVFTALNRWMMEEVQTELIFSTPNMQSRVGYIKLGWREIARVPHRWELAVRPQGSALIPSILPDALRTDWDMRALKWRSDPRCGHVYQTVFSADAVLYYRTFRRAGMPVVAPMAALGDSAECAFLWRRMLKQTRALFVLRPVTQAAPQPSTRFAIQRGESLILGWHAGTGILALARRGVLDTVPWSAADVEGVI